MEFQEQTITIKAGYARTKYQGDILTIPESDHMEIPAMVALGTGLAYHETVSDDRDTYTVTHMSSGLAVGDTAAWDSEDQAKHFIELIAHLTNWNRPADEVWLERATLVKQLRSARDECKKIS